MFFGKKNHAHAVFTKRWQGHAHGTVRGRSSPGHVFAVQRVRQLDQDARAVTHQFIGTHRTPVVQVLQNLQCLADDGMGFTPLDVRHKTHATGVVLLGGVIQTMGESGLHRGFP